MKIPKIPAALLLIAQMTLCNGWANDALKIANGQAAIGPARFTVLTPNCVRIEWGAYVDVPTLFAYNRSARCNGAQVTGDSKEIVIDTGRFRLTYQPDGKKFNANNLKVTFKKQGKNAEWNPELKNSDNLGGPVATLDTWSGPRQVTDGLLSRQGWFLLDDSASPLLTGSGIVQRPGGFRPGLMGSDFQVNPDRDWYLFVYGTDYKAALQSLAAVSGPATMPRRQIFGTWYCRWFNYTADDFREIARGYNDHGFPLDIIVMDMGWHTQAEARTGNGHGGSLGWSGYTWNKKLIPDPEKLIQDFKRNGLFVVLNDHPSDGVRSHDDCYQEFMKMLPEGTPANPPFNAGDPRYMNAFFEASHAPLEKQGVDFWWVDWQQDYIYQFVYGVPGLKHLPWLNHLYFKHSEAGGQRGQGFSRWGGWGGHRYPIQFSGDTAVTWDMLRFEVPFTANSGNAGCFFWAHDIGGFAGGREPEMYARWTQFGALSASLRVHSFGQLDRRPWIWGEPFVQSMRKAYQLRAKLMPYIYTSARQCYDQTLPLLRPMYLEYPELEQAYQNPQEYLFGDHLLAAPVVSPGKGKDFLATQKVWFPQGVWFNFLTGEKYQGDTEVTVKATIDEIPLYVKAGVPIPMQPGTLRTTTPLTTLIIRCYPGLPGVSATSSLYEDDGQSQGYLKQAFATTALSYRRVGNQVAVKISPARGSYEGQPARRSYRIELPCTTKGAEAILNGASIPVEYDEENRLNVIQIPEACITEGLEVKVKTSEADPALASAKAAQRRNL